MGFACSVVGVVLRGRKICVTNTVMDLSFGVGGEDNDEY